MSASVVVYTTGLCGFCHAAKALLGKKGVPFEEVGCDGRPDLRSWLREVTSQRTVPQIFINGESVGGFSELSALDRSGMLDEQLSQPAEDPALELRR